MGIFMYIFILLGGHLITKSISSMLGVKFSSTILKQNCSLSILNAYFFMSLKTIITESDCV